MRDYYGDNRTPDIHINAAKPLSAWRAFRNALAIALAASFTLIATYIILSTAYVGGIWLLITSLEK